MTPVVGMRLQLRGHSSQGKRLVKMCSVWRVVQIEDEVHFSKRAGPWLLVEPLVEDASAVLQGARWIHGRQDGDFAITKEV